MNIALMNHDRKKELMVQFCTAYCGILSKYTVCATNTTSHLVVEVSGLSVQFFLSHEHGDSQQVGARITYNEIDMVLLFSDPQPSDLDADLKYITALYDQYDIPFTIDVATVEILIHGLERGDLDWRDIISPKTKPFVAWAVARSVPPLQDTAYGWRGGVCRRRPTEFNSGGRK